MNLNFVNPTVSSTFRERKKCDMKFPTENIWFDSMRNVNNNKKIRQNNIITADICENTEFFGQQCFSFFHIVCTLWLCILKRTTMAAATATHLSIWLPLHKILRIIWKTKANMFWKNLMTFVGIEIRSIFQVNPCNFHLTAGFFCNF